tara:strand:- start:306 stop:836 length:531 start_codon:yes stop_codon:yes gene_type:complete
MALTKITETSASGSGNIAFTSSIDSTYKLYIFKLIEIHPASMSHFTVNFSTDGGSNYNVSKTTTCIVSYNIETSGDHLLHYRTSGDLGSSTDYQQLMQSLENDADSNGSGYLHLYNPSNTTYYKHISSQCSYHRDDGYAFNMFIGGMLETTSAINAVNFKMDSGNIDAGTIEMWGL